jgi:hypothetical protein
MKSARGDINVPSSMVISSTNCARLQGKGTWVGVGKGVRVGIGVTVGEGVQVGVIEGIRDGVTVGEAVTVGDWNCVGVMTANVCDKITSNVSAS